MTSYGIYLNAEINVAKHADALAHECGNVTYANQDSGFVVIETADAETMERILDADENTISYSAYDQDARYASA